MAELVRCHKIIVTEGLSVSPLVISYIYIYIYICIYIYIFIFIYSVLGISVGSDERDPSCMITLKYMVSSFFSRSRN